MSKETKIISLTLSLAQLHKKEKIDEYKNQIPFYDLGYLFNFLYKNPTIIDSLTDFKHLEGHDHINLLQSIIELIMDIYQDNQHETEKRKLFQQVNRLANRCDKVISKRFSTILSKLFVYGKMSENEKLIEIIKNHDSNDLLDRQKQYLQNLDDSLQLQQAMKGLSELHLLNIYVVTFPNQRGLIGKLPPATFYRVDPKQDEDYFSIVSEIAPDCFRISRYIPLLKQGASVYQDDFCSHYWKTYQMSDLGLPHYNQNYQNFLMPSLYFDFDFDHQLSKNSKISELIQQFTKFTSQNEIGEYLKEEFESYQQRQLNLPLMRWLNEIPYLKNMYKSQIMPQECQNQKTRIWWRWNIKEREIQKFSLKSSLKKQNRNKTQHYFPDYQPKIEWKVQTKGIERAYQRSLSQLEDMIDGDHFSFKRNQNIVGCPNLSLIYQLAPQILKEFFISYASPEDAIELLFESKVFDIVRLIPSENFEKALNESPHLLISYLRDYLPQISQQKMPDDAEGQNIVHNTIEIVKCAFDKILRLDDSFMFMKYVGVCQPDIFYMVVLRAIKYASLKILDELFNKQACSVFIKESPGTDYMKFIPRKRNEESQQSGRQWNWADYALLYSKSDEVILKMLTLQKPSSPSSLFLFMNRTDLMQHLNTLKAIQQACPLVMTDYELVEWSVERGKPQVLNYLSSTNKLNEFLALVDDSYPLIQKICQSKSNRIAEIVLTALNQKQKDHFIHVIDSESALNPLEYAFKTFKALSPYCVSPKNMSHLSITSNYPLTLSLGFDNCEQGLIRALYPSLISQYEQLCIQYKTSRDFLFNQNFNLINAIKEARVEPLIALKIFFKSILKCFPSYGSARSMQNNGCPNEDPDDIEFLERQMPFISQLLILYDDMKKQLTIGSQDERFAKALVSLEIEFFTVDDYEIFMKSFFRNSSQKSFIILIEQAQKSKHIQLYNFLLEQIQSNLENIILNANGSCNFIIANCLRQNFKLKSQQIAPVKNGSGILNALSYGYTLKRFLDESQEDIKESIKWVGERIRKNQLDIDDEEDIQIQMITRVQDLTIIRENYAALIALSQDLEQAKLITQTCTKDQILRAAMLREGFLEKTQLNFNLLENVYSILQSIHKSVSQTEQLIKTKITLDSDIQEVVKSIFNINIWIYDCDKLTLNIYSVQEEVDSITIEKLLKIISWFMNNRSLFTHFDIMDTLIVIDFDQKFNFYKVDSIYLGQVALIGCPNQMLGEENLIKDQKVISDETANELRLIFMKQECLKYLPNGSTDKILSSTTEEIILALYTYFSSSLNKQYYYQKLINTVNQPVENKDGAIEQFIEEHKSELGLEILEWSQYKEQIALKLTGQVKELVFTLVIIRSQEGPLKIVMKDDFQTISDLQRKTESVIEKKTNKLSIVVNYQSLLKEVALKVCPAELAPDSFYDMIINRSKVIQAIIKDIYESFDGFTNMPMHKYNVLYLSFKTNEISKNMSEQTSAYIFDRSVHIDGYKIIDEVDNSCSLQIQLSFKEMTDEENQSANQIREWFGKFEWCPNFKNPFSPFEGAILPIKNSLSQLSFEKMVENTSLSYLFFQLNSTTLFEFLNQSQILKDLKVLTDELNEAFKDGGMLQTKFKQFIDSGLITEYSALLQIVQMVDEITSYPTLNKEEFDEIVLCYSGEFNQQEVFKQYVDKRIAIVEVKLYSYEELAELIKNKQSLVIVHSNARLLELYQDIQKTGDISENSSYFLIAEGAEKVLQFTKVLGQEIFPELSHYYNKKVSIEQSLLSFTQTISPRIFSSHSSTSLLSLIKNHYKLFVEVFVDTLIDIYLGLIKELGNTAKAPFAFLHYTKFLYFFLADSNIGKINLKYNGIDEEDLDGDFNFIVKESGIEECQREQIEQYIFEKIYQNVRSGFDKSYITQQQRGYEVNMQVISNIPRADTGKEYFENAVKESFAPEKISIVLSPLDINKKSLDQIKGLMNISIILTQLGNAFKAFSAFNRIKVRNLDLKLISQEKGQSDSYLRINYQNQTLDVQCQLTKFNMTEIEIISQLTLDLTVFPLDKDSRSNVLQPVTPAQFIYPEDPLKTDNVSYDFHHDKKDNSTYKAFMLHQFSKSVSLNVEVNDKMIRVKYSLERGVKDQLSQLLIIRNDEQIVCLRYVQFKSAKVQEESKGDELADSDEEKNFYVVINDQFREKYQALSKNSTKMDKYYHFDNFILSSKQSSKQEIAVSSLHLFDGIYKITLRSLGQFNPTNYEVSFNALNNNEFLKKYPIYYQSHKQSYEIKVEVPAFMNKEWIKELGDLKVIIPLKNDGVKLKKSKKSGLEKLIQFQVKYKGNPNLHPNEFKLYMKNKGNNRSIMDEIPFRPELQANVKRELKFFVLNYPEINEDSVQFFDFEQNALSQTEFVQYKKPFLTVKWKPTKKGQYLLSFDGQTWQFEEPFVVFGNPQQLNDVKLYDIKDLKNSIYQNQGLLGTVHFEDRFGNQLDKEIKRCKNGMIINDLIKIEFQSVINSQETPDPAKVIKFQETMPTNLDYHLKQIYKKTSAFFLVSTGYPQLTQNRLKDMEFKVAIKVNSITVDYIDFELLAQKFDEKYNQLQAELQKFRKDYPIVHNVDRENLGVFLNTVSMDNLKYSVQIRFQGEFGIDAGGLAREFYSVMGEYLKNPKTQLFEELENKLYSVSPQSVQKYKDDSVIYQKVGALIANSILYMENIEILLSKNTFNYLLGKKPTLNDLKDEHNHYYNTYLMYCKYRLEQPELIDSLEQYFTISDFNGQEVPICANGKEMKLNNDNLEKWVKELTQFKLHREIERQLYHFKLGFTKIIPAIHFENFESDEFNILLGGKVIYPETLIPMIDFNVTNLLKGFVVQYIQNSDFMDLQKFVQFITGRKSVPVQQAERIRVDPMHGAHRYNTQRIPEAHTCFFQLCIPDYQTFEQFKKKMDIAIDNCVGFELA